MMGLRYFALILLSISFTVSVGQGLPEGFALETLASDAQGAVGIRNLNDSTSFIWTLDGRILVLENDILLPNAILNISEQVAAYADHGMAGMALDPQFSVNGFIYLLYPADTYYMLHSEDPDYDPSLSYDYQASVGRIAKHKVDPFPPYTHYPDETVYLLGEHLYDGIPVMGSSHGMGSLEFGADGTLIASCGDGSVWSTEFNGGPPYPELAFDEQGLALGILRPDENIGSFRSQYPNSLSGKILRIDPVTGEGIASNPFFLESSPDSSVSKVWALGLRNPFRMCRRPGTGQSDPLAGVPGTFYLGDVGYYSWEEINAVTGPGQNFGWPIMEGMQGFPVYQEMLTAHPLYENPLFLEGDCDQSHFSFQDLLIQPKEDHSVVWSNACDINEPLADSLITFIHKRPVFAYTNGWSWNEYLCVTPGFDDAGNAIGTPVLTNPDIEGEDFVGFASLGGDFYYGLSYPEEYFGAYFQSDYSGWLKAFWFDQNNSLYRIQSFSDELAPFLCTRFNPYDECLYGVTATQELVRICYTGNVPPQAIINQDVYYGASPLEVNFDAGSSFDPDGDPISFYWEFGDGTSSEEMNPSHIYTAPDAMPISYDISLTVTDTAGNARIVHSLVSLNNTPPLVQITGIQEDALFSNVNITPISLLAEVSDNEHSDAELTYKWTIELIHNQHSHPEAMIEDHAGSYELMPITCSDNANYVYSVSLTVTDPQGLSGQDIVTLEQDCSGLSLPTNDRADVRVYPNPNNGVFTLSGLFDQGEEILLNLIDLKGSSVFKEKLIWSSANPITIDLHRVKQGYYILNITSSSLNANVKLIIE